MCCSAGQVCAANVCALPPPKPTATPTNTPSNTATQTHTATLTPKATATSMPGDTPTPTYTPDPRCAGKPDGATCDAGVDSGATRICVSGQCLTCVPDGNGVAGRFVDNGDGTITDLHTCLVWEKKDDSGSVHDQDNAYTWSTCTDPTCPPDGTAFTVFLATLNGSGFAGHRDWRMPRSAGLTPPTNDPPELESLIPASPICAPSPSTVCVYVYPEFATNCGAPWLPTNEGCTIDGAGGTEECSCTGISNFYYSLDTTYETFLPDPYGSVWAEFGAIVDANEAVASYVRAVRGGAVGCTPTTCEAQGTTRGWIPDRCGYDLLNCFSCTTAGDICGGGGVPNQCACVDNGLACADQVCGTRVNNCGQEVSCGTCPASAPKWCIDSCVATPECP